MVRKKGVFLVHKFESFDGKKHNVSFGRDFNNPKNNRRFTKLSDAKRFAINKARKIGVKTVLMDLPAGTKDVIVKVPMKNKKARQIRKKAKKASFFDIGF